MSSPDVGPILAGFRRHWVRLQPQWLRAGGSPTAGDYFIMICVLLSLSPTGGDYFIIISVLLSLSPTAGDYCCLGIHHWGCFYSLGNILSLSHKYTNTKHDIPNTPAQIWIRLLTWAGVYSWGLARAQAARRAKQRAERNILSFQERSILGQESTATGHPQLLAGLYRQHLLLF